MKVFESFRQKQVIRFGTVLCIGFLLLNQNESVCTFCCSCHAACFYCRLCFLGSRVGSVRVWLSTTKKPPCVSPFPYIPQWSILIFSLQNMISASTFWYLMEKCINYSKSNLYFQRKIHKLFHRNCLFSLKITEWSSPHWSTFLSRDRDDEQTRV